MHFGWKNKSLNSIISTSQWQHEQFSVDWCSCGTCYDSYVPLINSILQDVPRAFVHSACGCTDSKATFLNSKNPRNTLCCFMRFVWLCTGDPRKRTWHDLWHLALCLWEHLFICMFEKYTAPFRKRVLHTQHDQHVQLWPHMGKRYLNDSVLWPVLGLKIGIRCIKLTLVKYIYLILTVQSTNTAPSLLRCLRHHCCLLSLKFFHHKSCSLACS